LQKILVPLINDGFKEQLDAVKDLVLAEVNVKELQYLTDDGGVLVKKIKANFKSLGPKYSKLMKDLSNCINTMTADDIRRFEKDGTYPVQVQGQEIILVLEDVEILSEDIPGWLVANEGRITVALDITVTEELREEGIARELVNRIQNLRKDSGFDVTDKIKLTIQRHYAINDAIEKHKAYIGAQTLAQEVILTDNCNDSAAIIVEIDDEITTQIAIEKV
jgi:isoleucyl-tRNA synthetase